MKMTGTAARALGLLTGLILTSSASLAQATAAAPKSQRNTPDTYGTTVESYYRMAAAEFTPLKSSFSYQDRYYDEGPTNFRRYATFVCSGCGFIASPHLPSGALLTYLELDSCDFSAVDVTLELYNCDYGGYCGSGPVKTLSSDNNVVPNACSYVGEDISALGLIVNNYGRQLSIRINNLSGDGTTSFSGAVLGYKLQVAPAPATPTFNDVPTSDFGFQYIEALNLWGITGGCGGGAYCPDSPVTRRQMAIFIAKALGLYLQQY